MNGERNPGDRVYFILGQIWESEGREVSWKWNIPAFLWLFFFFAKYKLFFTKYKLVALFFYIL